MKTTGWTGASRWRSDVRLITVLIGSLLLTGCHRTEEGPTESAAEPRPTPSRSQPVVPATERSQSTGPLALDPGEEISLFDGETLGRWKVTDFGGQGKVHVKDGAIYMEMGSYMTGITWTGPVVRMHYEITLDAMRVEGNDFFCGLTFPVGDRPCSLILGGWGGTVCGLSNVDYYDASENETTRIIGFDNGQWYHVRLRVLPDRIQAWLDGEELVDIETTGRHIDIRSEVDLSQPLGVATWITTGAVKNIRLKKLPPESH